MRQQATTAILTLLFEPYASFCPLTSQHRQCSSSSSDSEPPFGLSQPGCGGLFQLALGIVWLSTFHINTCREVAPAIKAPSGVKASRTIGESMVRKHFALLSGFLAFHINMAQSSPPVAISRSSSGAAWFGGSGCQAMVVMAPWWAEIDRLCPDSSQSYYCLHGQHCSTIPSPDVENTLTSRVPLSLDVAASFDRQSKRTCVKLSSPLVSNFRTCTMEDSVQ